MLSIDILTPMLFKFPLLKAVLKPKRVKVMFETIDLGGDGYLT